MLVIYASFSIYYVLNELEVWVLTTPVTLYVDIGQEASFEKKAVDKSAL